MTEHAFGKLASGIHDEFVNTLRERHSIPENWEYARHRMTHEVYDQLIEAMGEGISIISGISTGDAIEVSFFYSIEKALEVHNDDHHL